MRRGTDVGWEEVLEESFEGYDPVGRQLPVANLMGLLRVVPATQSFQGFQGPCFGSLCSLKRIRNASHPLGWLLSKKKKKKKKERKEKYVGKDVEKLQPLCTACGDVNWYSH